MNKILYMLLLAFLAAAGFLAGTRYNARKISASTRASGGKPIYYVDPMHPAYKSDKPGIAPDCGMQLVPVYAEGLPASVTSTALALPGSVHFDAAKQQLFGVRVGSVEQTSGSYKLRLLGRVLADETKIYKINAGIEGYIQDVSAATTGSFVRKDQVLATFAAPNASMTLQTFVLNLGAEDRFKKSAAEGSVEGQSVASVNANLQLRHQQLQNLGMSALQMDEIRRTRQIPDTIKIVSPVDGFLLTRNVSPGQKFDRNAEWYRIADLRRVWVVADVYEQDTQYIHPGAPVRLHLSNQNKALQGRVSNVLPQFDSGTRTFKTRIEVDNPGYILRPDMFVDVELPLTYSPTITVPASAVLDSGVNKTVFIQRGEGLFSPRAVETGRLFGDRVEIVKGLEPGEQIVTSGNFMINSESRLKEAVEMYAPPDPEQSRTNSKASATADEQSLKNSGPGAAGGSLPQSDVTPEKQYHRRRRG